MAKKEGKKEVLSLKMYNTGKGFGKKGISSKEEYLEEGGKKYKMNFTPKHGNREMGFKIGGWH